MNKQTKQRIKELTGNIACANSEEVLKFKCPNCGGNLVIHFTGEERRSLGVSCPKHCFATNLDGMAEDPKWVSELGVHILTEQRPQGDE